MADIVLVAHEIGDELFFTSAMVVSRTFRRSGKTVREAGYGLQCAFRRDIAARRGKGSIDVRKEQLSVHRFSSIPKSQISHAKPPGGSSTPP